LRNRCSIPGSVASNYAPDWPGKHPTSYSMGSVVYYSGMKRPGGEAYDSPKSTGFKNEWRHTSTPRTSLCRAQGELYSYLHLNCGRMVWNGLNWLKTRSSSWSFCTRHWILGFHGRPVISRSHKRPAGRNLLEFYMLVVS
jgi:hypothetical protein